MTTPTSQNTPIAPLLYRVEEAAAGTRAASTPTNIRTARNRRTNGMKDGAAMPDEYLTTEEVAAWLKVAASTVCRWRLARKGPRVTWLSPTLPRYRRADLLVWLEEVAA